MTDVLTYKDFIGSVHFSAEDQVFFGRIEGINDLVTFEGESVKELIQAFHYMVDEHIKDCQAEGISILKSYKGSMNIRLQPETHRLMSMLAILKKGSINELIQKAADEFLASHTQFMLGVNVSRSNPIEHIRYSPKPATKKESTSKQRKSMNTTKKDSTKKPH